MSEITWSWDGSAVARTSSLGAVWTVESWDVKPARPLIEHKQVDLLSALVDTVETVLDPVREWELVVKADVSALTGSVVERKLVAGWEELAEAFNPCGGVAKLQATRKDLAAADVTRYLLGEILDAPSYSPRTAEPKGRAESGGYEGAGGYIIYVVRGRTVFPYWVGSTLLNQDTAPANAELAIGASPDTVVINNASPRWVGVRLDCGSVSGSVTRFSVENAANGDSVIVNNAGPFDNNDYVDLLATDPRKPDFGTANTFPGPGHVRLRLEPGSNTLTGTRLVGTGTLTLSLSWPSLDLSL